MPPLTPAPVQAASWPKPVPVGSTGDCYALTAGIDAASRYHVAATCPRGILYAVSAPGGAWSATVFPEPSNRMQQDPQIGFDGNIVYLAYSWLAVGEGACGDDGLSDVGVYYRHRTLPGGAWSEPVRIGLAKDHLEAFRVEGATLHAVVQNEGDGGTYYETLNGNTFRRYRLAASDPTSLRIGQDGRARIAYAASGSIRIATFTGSGFSTAKIPGSDGGTAPLLVLDGRDRAHVIWTRNPGEWGGCAGGPEPDPKAGTYYATNASGHWTSSRITARVGTTSLQVDPLTGRVHVLVGDDSGLRYYTKPAGSGWIAKRLVSNAVGSAVIRLDPATGTLLVLYMREAAGASRIYAITKPQPE